MKKIIGIYFTIMLFVAVACRSTGSISQPKATLSPITIGSDLTAIDLCQVIPRESIEAVMGRKLVSAPQRFEWYDASGTSGCSYDGGKDSRGNAYFGYIVLTPAEVYSNQPLYEEADVPGIGESAYFTNGADARQLWVKMNDRLAFVVAFGDQPNEAGAIAVAKLIAAAIR